VSAPRYDAVVIGGGQNGLAAALRLGLAGRKVVVLERRTELGGLCGAIEFHPGYRAPGILHDEGLVSPRVVAALGLEKHGFAWREAPPTFLAEEGGRGILLDRDPAKAEPELAARSRHDAEAYRRYRAFIAKLRPLVEQVMTSPPPPLTPSGAGDFWDLAKRGLGLWRLGRRDTLELMRVAPMCVADFLNEQFETALLVEGLAAPAVIGTFAGPWSAGTTTNLLLHEAAPGRHVAGGPPALIAALERAARAAGVEIRTAAGVERIRVENGKAVGVVVGGGDGAGDGESIDAATIVSTCDPKRTFLHLIAAGTLPIRIEEEFRRIRMRGTAARVHLALSGPLELAARSGQLIESLRIGGGHVDDLERAFDAVKYREVAAKPYLDVRVPTVADASLAPAGHHVASISVSYVSHEVHRGWTDERRVALVESVLSAVERHAPTLRQRLVAHELLTPADLAERYALTGGQLHHGEPALDQLVVLRPTASSARYATAVAGLYLGGSGSHGGGGVTCAAGWLASEGALAG
jgi:phytoene dehydrogenase-like protein